MDDNWLLEILDNYPIIKTSVIILGVLLGCKCIEFTPIKINPLNWILNGLGKILNSSITGKIDDLSTKVDTLQIKLDDHVKKQEEDYARNSRQKILRFNDEIIQKTFHTKESWDQMLEDIDTYEMYCKNHPDYPNNKCLMAIKHLKAEYSKCLDNNSFLSVDDDIKEIRKRKQKEQ